MDLLSGTGVATALRNVQWPYALPYSTIAVKFPSEQLRKVEKIKPFGYSRAPKKTEMPHFDHFPRPGEIDPYAVAVYADWYAHIRMKPHRKIRIVYADMQIADTQKAERIKTAYMRKNRLCSYEKSTQSD